MCFFLPFCTSILSFILQQNNYLYQLILFQTYTFSISYIKLITQMINGIKISEIPQIKRNRITHLQRLSRISDSKNHFNSLSLNHTKMLSTKKSNHENWKNYQKNHEQQVLNKRNQKLFNKIISVTMEKSPYHLQQSFERTIYRHHNSKVQNIKRIRMIDEENPEIAKRISQKTANFNHEKDLQQFRNTRKIANRLKKFNIVKRMSNIRSKTLPSKSFKTESSQINSDIEPKE